MRSVRARTHASALSLIHVHVQAHSMSICHASHQLLKLPHARSYSYRGRVKRWQLNSTSTSCWRHVKRRCRTQQQLRRPALSRCLLIQLQLLQLQLLSRHLLQLHLLRLLQLLSRHLLQLLSGHLMQLLRRHRMRCRPHGAQLQVAQPQPKHDLEVPQLCLTLGLRL